MAEFKEFSVKLTHGVIDDWKPKVDRSRTGSQNPDDIWLSVGRALSAWEGVENQLTELFLVVTDHREYRASKRAITRAFGDINDHGTKRSALTSAAEVYFDKYWERLEIRAPFLQILESFKFASYIRNDIAHGKVHSWVLVSNIEGKQVRNEKGNFLCAPEYKTKSNRAKNDPAGCFDLNFTYSKYLYTHEDLDDYTRKFLALHMAFVRYTHFIMRTASGRPACVDKLLAREAEAAADKVRKAELYTVAQPEARQKRNGRRLKREQSQKNS